MIRKYERELESESKSKSKEVEVNEVEDECEGSRRNMIGAQCGEGAVEHVGPALRGCLHTRAVQEIKPHLHGRFAKPSQPTLLIFALIRDYLLAYNNSALWLTWILRNDDG